MGRPKLALLDRDRIARAALRLVDQEGPDAFSMRRLGRELGVNPSSLYNHVDGAAEVIEDVRGIISEAIDSSHFDVKPFAEALVVWARSYRAAFARHPRSIPLLMSTSAKSPVTMRMWDSFTSAAVRVGWPIEEVLPLLTAIESFILGSVLDMSGPSLLFDPQGQEAQFPHFAAAFEAVDRSLEHPIADRAFELGLRAIVEYASDPGAALR